MSIYNPVWLTGLKAPTNSLLRLGPVGGASVEKLVVVGRRGVYGGIDYHAAVVDEATAENARTSPMDCGTRVLRHFLSCARVSGH